MKKSWNVCVAKNYLSSIHCLMLICVVRFFRWYVILKYQVSQSLVQRKASITLTSPNISKSQDIFFITLETCLFFSCVFGIKSLPEVICCATDAWRYDSFQIWELPEKLYSRTFMLDVHCNRIIALHQTHILIFQFGHYVWRRLFEGDIFVYLIKTRMPKMKVFEKKPM